jgi:polyhydroxyalkanoate synthase
VGLDAYVADIIESIEAVRKISGSERVHVLAVCAGGQLGTIALANLAAQGRDDAIASLSLLVCVLDYAAADLPQSLMSPEATETALKPIRSKGYMDGRDLTLALAWLRPIDAVWYPWVHRYLMAEDMPKLDMFHWSEDVSNLPAAYIEDQFALARSNALVHPGELVVLGERIDLGKIRSDAYVIAGLMDHLTPWESAYRTTQMLGSDTRFVLVRGGHIQSILRSPNERMVPFLHSPETPPDPAEWLAGAEAYEESWWNDWLRWLDDRSSAERGKRRTLGSRDYPPMDPAPGLYVRRRLDTSDQDCGSRDDAQVSRN